MGHTFLEPILHPSSGCKHQSVDLFPFRVVYRLVQVPSKKKVSITVLVFFFQDILMIACIIVGVVLSAARYGSRAVCGISEILIGEADACPGFQRYPASDLALF